MRLAEHKAKIVKAKSIREARELLPKAKPRGSQPQPADSDQPAGDFEPKASDEPTFEDEVEVRAPDELFAVLVQQWDDDELTQLVKLISDHLQKKKSATPPPKPQISNTVTKPAASSIKRPLSL